MIVDGGHEIGMHGYSHENPIAMSPEQEEAGVKGGAKGGDEGGAGVAALEEKECGVGREDDDEPYKLDAGGRGAPRCPYGGVVVPTA